MSNVIGFKAFKNTLKRDSGYAPVSGENGYSVIRCVFPVGGDWDGISAVSAGFFVHPKDIVGVTEDIAEGEERAAEFTIPGALLKQGERLHFGLFATVNGVTIATNTVVLDVARGIVSDDIDTDPTEAASMFEQFSNALNTALLGKADKVTRGNVAGNVLTADSNGNIQSSGYNVDIVSLGAGIPTSRLVQQELNGKANAANTLTGYGITDAYTKEQTDDLIAGKADKLVNGDNAFTDRILIASNNGGIKNSGYSINNARLSGDVNLTVPSSNVVANALAGKADKTAAGTDGELAAVDGNGAMIRSGFTVAESVGGGSDNMVPTTEAVRQHVFSMLDEALNGSDDGAPSLFVRLNTQTGKYQLVYVDSNDNLHVLFDFGLLPSGGTSNYNDLSNKPQINNVTLDGSRGASEFGLQNAIITVDSQNPPSGTATRYDKPYLWINDVDHTVFILRRVDDTQAPREYFYWWDRLSNRCIVSTDAPPAYLANNVNPMYDVGDIWAQKNSDGTQLVSTFICTKKTRHSFDYITWRYEFDWLKIGGSPIVSGVVNQNGTITFTDSDGNTFTTTGQSVIGPQGPQGAPGDDYVLTAQDKADIANIVLQLLPTTQGVLYGNTSN